MKEKLKAIGALLFGVALGAVVGLLVGNSTSVPVWFAVASLGAAGGVFVFQLRTGWGGWPGKRLSWASKRSFLSVAVFAALGMGVAPAVPVPDMLEGTDFVALTGLSAKACAQDETSGGDNDAGTDNDCNGPKTVVFCAACLGAVGSCASGNGWACLAVGAACWACVDVAGDCTCDNMEFSEFGTMYRCNGGAWQTIKS